MSTSEGKYVLVEVGALISWWLYSYRIVMLLVPYMWASMTFSPKEATAVPIPSLYHTVGKESSYTLGFCLYFSKNQGRNYSFTARADC